MKYLLISLLFLASESYSQNIMIVKIGIINDSLYIDDYRIVNNTFNLSVKPSKIGEVNVVVMNKNNASIKYFDTNTDIEWNDDEDKGLIWLRIPTDNPNITFRVIYKDKFKYLNL